MNNSVRSDGNRHANHRLRPRSVILPSAVAGSFQRRVHRRICALMREARTRRNTDVAHHRSTAGRLSRRRPHHSVFGTGRSDKDTTDEPTATTYAAWVRAWSPCLEVWSVFGTELADDKVNQLGQTDSATEAHPRFVRSPEPATTRNRAPVPSNRPRSRPPKAICTSSMSGTPQ